MKWALAIAGLASLVASSAAETASFRVRLLTAHPVSEVEFASANHGMRWKQCVTCPELSAGTLKVSTQGGGLLVDGKRLPELLVLGSYELRAEGHPPLKTEFPLSVRARGGKLLIVATIPAERYVTAVIAGEAGAIKEPEALKALAIVVRTYAMKFRGRHSWEQFDFCDSTHCQNLNFAAISEHIRTAVQATRNQTLWYGGELAATYYHQDCGGRTASAQDLWSNSREPYLNSHVDTYCLRSSHSITWRTELTRANLNDSLRDQGFTPPNSWREIRVIRRDAGRVIALDFFGGAPAHCRVNAPTFRFAINRSLGWNRIRSDLYEVENQPTRILFAGHGSGHGVGLCQNGAQEMAREGKSYRDILSYYYPGTSLGPAKSQEWMRRAGNRVDLLTKDPLEDGTVLVRIEQLLSHTEDALGWKLNTRPEIYAYPSIDAYRKATKQPGWVAAVTRRRMIRIQPLAMLRERNVLDFTLRHEFLHLLIEEHASRETPLWFREGLALYFDEGTSGMHVGSMTEDEMEQALRHSYDRAELQRAYGAARTKVATMMRERGKTAVLDLLTSGVGGSTIGLGSESHY